MCSLVYFFYRKYFYECGTAVANCMLQSGLVLMVCKLNITSTLKPYKIVHSV